MKINWLSLLLTPVIFILIYMGYQSLQISLTTKAIDSRLNYFSESQNPSLSENDEKLAKLVLDTSSSPANTMNNYVLFLQWRGYLSISETEESELVPLLTLSSHIRPTWSNTYVELAKVMNNPTISFKYQNLALQFGPHTTASQLLLIDQTFTNWKRNDLTHRIAASESLVSMVRLWQHRKALNHMIDYSGGKVRICNLLAFNQLKVKACE